MLYWWFEGMNPLFPVFVLCPMLAVIMGACWYVLKASKRCSRTIVLGVSFLLPLLFITSDWATFTANLDVWLMYGVGYCLVTWATYRLLCTLKGYKS